MDATVDVCVVGSANLDLVATAARLPGPGETVLGSSFAEHAGGKGLNQAVAAARSGASTAFVGAVGGDAAGHALRRVLTADRIDDRRLRTVGEPTGRALITVDERGENSIVVVPGANATVTADDLPTSRVLLAQLEVPIDAVAAALAAAGDAGTITVLNPAPAAELPAGLLGRCDLVVPNEHELELLGGVSVLMRHGCDAVIVTLGGAGVEIHRRSGQVSVPPFAVDVVDTTGAGDAFCGALAARLAGGDDLESSVRWAAAAGALATTARGAVPAQPDVAAIEHLLATGRAPCAGGHRTHRPTT